MLKKIKANLKQFSKKDTAAAHFLQCIYRIFVHPIFQLVISCVYAIVSTTRWVINGKINWLMIIVSTGIYILIECGILIASNYRKEKNVKLNILQDVLDSCASINFQQKEYLLKELLKSKERNCKESIREISIFENTAWIICSSLHTILTDYYDNNSIKIEILQKYKNDTTDSDYVKMVAYKAKVNDQPKSFDKKFYINRKEIEKYFEEIFKKNIEDIQILADKEMVCKKFKDKSKKGNEVSQYIAIPGIVNNSEVVFLIQISVKQSNCFGSCDEIHEMINDVLLIYREILRLAYENDRAIEFALS